MTKYTRQDYLATYNLPLKSNLRFSLSSEVPSDMSDDYSNLQNTYLLVMALSTTHIM